MEKSLIVFRADGDPKSGLGHVSRCLSLAKKVGDMASTCFMIRDTDTSVLDSIKEEVDRIILLSPNSGMEDEITAVQENFPEPVVFVIDSYAHKLEFHQRIRAMGHLLVAIDDLHDHPVVADHLINIGAPDLENKYQLPFYTKTYFGFRYAFLKQPFLNIATETVRLNDFDKQIKHVFLCFGGADPEDFSLTTLKEIYSVFPEVQFHVVVGTMYQHKKQLDDFVQNNNRVQVYSGISTFQMADLMKSCQLGICSSSTISFEFLCSAGYLIIRKTADNQELIHSWLTSSGLALDYGLFKSEPYQSLKNSSFHLRAEILQDRLEFDYSVLLGRWVMESQLYLRLANKQDAQLYFDWANDPLTRSQSFQSDPIPWEDHRIWFERKLKSPFTRMLVMMYHQDPVGQLRFEIEKGRATINYSISPLFRGKDLGSVMISRSIQWLVQQESDITEVDGFVKLENIASQKVFLKNRFIEEKVIVSEKEEMHYLLYV